MIKYLKINVDDSLPLHNYNKRNFFIKWWMYNVLKVSSCSLPDCFK